MAQRDEIKLKVQHLHVATIKLDTSVRQNKEYKMDIQQKDQSIFMNSSKIESLQKDLKTLRNQHKCLQE